MSKIKSLFGDTLLYGLGSIIPRMINFFLILPQTKVFNPEEYGVLTDLYAWVAIFNIVFSFGLETAYFRFSTRSGANPEKVFHQTQTLVLVNSLVFSLTLIGFVYPIAKGLNLQGQENLIIQLVLVMFLDAVVTIPFARLRLERKPLQFALAKIINVLILVFLNVYFLQFAYDPAIGVAYVILINLVANGFYLIFFVKMLFSWRPMWNREMFFTLIKYSFPIMVTGLAGMTNEMFSRITLTWWLPKDFYGPDKSSAYALGIFGACYKFAVMMNLAVQAFRFAAEPFFFAHAEDKHSPALFARINHYFVVVCCLLLLGVSINLDILKWLLRSEAYWEGLYIVPVLLLAYLFLGVYYNFSVWFKLTDRTYFGTLITTGGVLVTILLNYLLIPYFGYWGSSLAAFSCYFSMAVACYGLGQRYFPVPYPILKDGLLIGITMALVYAVARVEIGSQFWATVFHFFVLFLYGMVLYWLERKSLKDMLRPVEK